MTVLIVPSWYRSGNGAQLGSFFREQALALKKQGLNVIVADATLQGRDNIFSNNMFRLRKYDDEGLITYSYITPALGATRTKSGGVRRYKKNLKKIFKKIVDDDIKIDIIHAHSFFPAGYVATKLAKEYGIPVVVTEHSSGIISHSIEKEKIRLLKETVELSDKFICVGEGLKKAVISYTATVKDLQVIPNMVSPIFCPLDAKNTNEFSFVSIGNLIYRKRFDLTIRSFAKAFLKNKQVNLKIIGDGELKDELMRLANELGLENRVHFLGKLDRNAVANELRKSDVFVLSSDHETFGVVYIEALASGVPVIGTRNGGAEDIITKENGILVDTNNEEQLSKAMNEIYKNKVFYSKNLLSDLCNAEYGQESVCCRIIDVYNDVVLKKQQTRSK